MLLYHKQDSFQLVDFVVLFYQLYDHPWISPCGNRTRASDSVGKMDVGDHTGLFNTFVHWNNIKVGEYFALLIELTG